MQWLGPRVASTEDQGLIPRTYLATHNHPQLKFHGMQCPLLASVGPRHTCGTDRHNDKTPTHSKLHLLKNYTKKRKQVLKGLHLWKKIFEDLRVGSVGKMLALQT